MMLELTDRKIEVADSILDLPLKKYFGITKCLEKLPKEDEEIEKYLNTLEGQLVFFDIVENIIPDYDTIKVEDMEIVNNYVSKMLTNIEIPTEVKPFIEVDGVKYITRDLKGMHGLETGEYISMKVYQERFQNDLYQYAPYVLAILVRPGREEFDEETGTAVFVQNKFDKKDIANLEFRAARFLNVRAGDIIPVLNFFLNGKD